ncbi:DUF6262 family protein [Phytomonospora sp. NPDC050363]|uniref:DUF6262 family protein n=1 Tax=Phytomonospora sp. NPDC050363 TaxID=3155642 RepID=UPI0033E87B3D
MGGAPDVLAAARRRDTEQRHARVLAAIKQMATDADDITISAVAARARVHRSFIHRHPDLRTAVLAAAEAPTLAPSATLVSRKSLMADNANLRHRNNRLATRVRDLEDRLGEILGEQAFQRSGLGAPTGTRHLEEAIEQQRQQILDLTEKLRERDEELEAARTANRGLMRDINRPH